MPRQGDGSYELPEPPFTNGTTADADAVNSNNADIAAALTQSISKDGQTTPTASLPMGGFKLTGLGAGTGNGESVRYNEFHTVDLNHLAAFRSHLAGLTLSNSAGSPNTVIDVAAGSCADDTNALVVTLSSGSINCATTGANGLDAGSLANNTWYHAFAIFKTDRTAALLASTSISSPTFPTGYTLKRRIGSFRTNGSAQIIAFVQDGDLFQWVAPVELDINANNPGASAVTRTLRVPTGVNVMALFQGVTINTASGVSVRAYFSDLATNDVAPDTDFLDLAQSANGIGFAERSGGRFAIRTNTSAQIRSRLSASDANVALVINTLGWIDRRGRDA